jgi:xanthine dehydrogenase accessory factor
MCGGTVHIFIHELTADSQEATIHGLEALVEERPSAVATLIDGPHAGSKLYVDESTHVGSLGGPRLLDANVEREARGLVSHGRTTVRHFGTDGTTLGTGLRVHVAAHAERPQMLILGAIDSRPRWPQSPTGWATGSRSPTRARRFCPRLASRPRRGR